MRPVPIEQGLNEGPSRSKLREMASAQVDDRTRKPLSWKRIVGYAISVVIVIGIFWWAIPKFADYRDVWAAIKTLTPIETWSLVAATIFNLS
jgi:hypothetical protein